MLNSLEKIKEIDKGNILGSIEALPNQCLHAWEEASKVEIPESYRSINSIVMTGMGGSGLGARFIEGLYKESLNFPLIRVNDYHLPGFANENTLVLCSSYSGNTEETVETLKEAQEKNAKIIVVATGGKLLEAATKDKLPIYSINPKHNPSKQPRMAIGYSVIGQLVLASKVGLFDLNKEDILIAVDAMKAVQEKCKASVSEETNPAKKLAKKMKGKVIAFATSHHLVGALHTVNNQLNENAKVFSSDFEIPELNHHLMEGLKHPTSNKENIFVFLAESSLFTDRMRKRFKVTKDVIEKNGIPLFSFKPLASTKLAQAFELVQFGAFVNLYLSVLYKQDPAPIPWVDYFKEELAK